MINKFNLISDEVVLGFKQVLGLELRELDAFYGRASLNLSYLSVSLGVNAVFSFGDKDSLIRFRLIIQGDDLFVKDESHIGLKFETPLLSIFDGSEYRFNINFPNELVVQKISFWSFAWRESLLPKLLNVVVFSLKNGKKLFLQLGSTCDAYIYLKDQSIQDYFNEKNQYYDNEFEIIEILTIE